MKGVPDILLGPTGIFAERPGLLFLLLVALLLDALLPDLPWLFRVLPHPAGLAQAMMRFADRRLNRARRSQRDRLVRGMLAVLSIAIIAAVAGWVATDALDAVPYGWVGELAILVAILGARRGFVCTNAVRRALAAGRIVLAREAAARLVARDTARLDAHAVARTGVEAAAGVLVTGVTAPAMWYVILGLPGAFFYAAVAATDTVVGHRSSRHRAFGLVAARLHDALTWLPAWLAGFLISLAAAFSPTASPTAAFRVMLGEAGKHPSPAAGPPEAAMAGALGLALSGPKRYASQKADDPWIGDGRARATAADVGRALTLCTVAYLLELILVALLALAVQAG